MADINAQAFSGVALNANAETLLQQNPTVNVNQPGSEGLLVRADVQITPGTGATGVTLRLYKGGGPGVGTLIATRICADPGGGSIGTLDQDTSLPATYALSAQAAGSSTNGQATGLLESASANSSW